jgi:hypothetical protein
MTTAYLQQQGNKNITSAHPYLNWGIGKQIHIMCFLAIRLKGGIILFTLCPAS